jgi:ribokinase
MVGSANMDLIVRVPRMPAPGETLQGSEFRTGFGGKGANQAVMAARLGGQVSVVVKLGHDSFGESTLRNFRDNDIGTSHVSFAEGVASGVAPITVDEGSGQNVVVIVPGANERLSVEDVRAAREAIVSSDVLMCQLETPLASTLEAFRIAREAGNVLTLLNPAPAAELPDELLRLTDVLVPNEVEAAALTGMPVKTREEAFAAAARLLERGPAIVVVTLGDRGAACAERGEEPFHAEAEPVRAVDATGAGDAFVGSLAYFLGSGAPLVEAVRRSCLVATLSVQKPGTQTSFPHRRDIEGIVVD